MGTLRDAASYLNPAAELLIKRFGPLVSVVVRTLLRPELKEALASICEQLYRPLEVVVVDASGRGTPPLLPCEDVVMRWVSLGRPLSRTQAANEGLAAASGELVCFLDEDDFFARTHLLMLVAALKAHPGFSVAYSGARTVGRTTGEIVFARPFSRARLLAGNFIPLHAALFSRQLVKGCAFDESLDLYEDWDFLLQLAAKSDFLFVPRVTAFYRAHGQSGVGAAAERIERGPAWEKVQKKWAARTLPGWDFRAAQELIRLDAELDRRDQELDFWRRRLAQMEAELAWVRGSRVWRYTAFPRALWRKVRGRKVVPLPNDAEAAQNWRPSPNMPLISVVLPIYQIANRAHLLREAIESVAKQEYPDLELLVVDDGSKDGSFDLAVALCGRVSIPARVLRKENGGQSSARNLGVRHALGEWVAFLDQDDAYLPHRFTAVVNNLSPNVALVYTDLDTMGPDGSPLWQMIHQIHGCGGSHPISRLEDAVSRDVFVVPGVTTVRRDLFLKIGGFDEQLSGYEDDDLFVRLSGHGEVRYVPRSTLRWRMHDESASHSERMVRSRMVYWEKLERMLLERGKPSLLRRVRRRFLWEFCRQALWALKDAPQVFDANYRGLRQALKRVNWSQRLGVLLTWMPLFVLARHSSWVRALVRTPRADWRRG